MNKKPLIAKLIIKRLLRMKADPTISDRKTSRWLIHIVESKFVRGDVDGVNELLRWIVPRQHSSHVINGLIRQTYRARKHIPDWDVFVMLSIVHLSDRPDAVGLFEGILPQELQRPHGTSHPSLPG